MMTPQECGKNPQNYDHFSLKVEDKNHKSEILHCFTRKCKTVKQSINMTDTAYDYMTSFEMPEWFGIKNVKKWKTMTPEARLEAHLQRTADFLGALSYSYEVFPD